MDNPTLPTAQERAEALAFGRGLGNIVMTALVPGSVQRAKGNRRIGRLAMRLWAMALVAMLVLGIWALGDRLALISFFAHPFVLRAATMVMLFLVFGWAALFLDTYRLSRPVDMKRSQRLPFLGLCLIVPLALIWGAIAGARSLGAAANLTSSVFAGGGDIEVHEGRINVLLVGADDGADREGMRTDSLNVVSIDAQTGRAVIVGVPRNLEAVRFSAGSPMNTVYPKGYFCPDHSCMINAVNTDVEQNHKDLYPGVKAPGLRATEEAVEWVTGLTINYTVVVDLNGFSGLVDATGGVDLTLKKPIVIYDVDAWGNGTPNRTIGPGHVHLNGKDTLDVARVRKDSSDFVRMTRQKCIMSAMLHQLDPQTVLTKFTDIANAGAGMVSSDVPASEAGYLVKLATKAKSLPVQTIQLIPPLLDPGSPDYDKARTAIAAQIQSSSAIDNPDKAPKPQVNPAPAPSTPAPTQSQAAGSKKAPVTAAPQPSETQAPDIHEQGAAQSDDLAATCSEL